MRSLRRFAIYFFLLVAGSAVAQSNPVGDPKSVVVSGNARCTVLTPQLIRMEWAADGKFEDHASLVFINRRLPVPEFRTSTADGWLTIDTGSLLLRYRIGSGTFVSTNLTLSFHLNASTVPWRTS